MSLADEQWWDLHTAEYVIGSLSDEERATFDRLHETDPDVQLRVADWRTRLDPLNASTAKVEPSAEVWQSVLARIRESGETTTDLHKVNIAASAESRAQLDKQLFGQAQSEQGSNQEISELDRARSDKFEAIAQVKSLERGRSRWRMAAIGSMAAAATLAGIVLFNPSLLAPPDNLRTITVAVLQAEDTSALFAVNYKAKAISDEANDTTLSPLQRWHAYRDSSIDEVLPTLTISMVGAPTIKEDQDYQLWMVLADDKGVQSVGILPSDTGASSELSLPISINKAVAFAVSLEPKGGSPESGPSGPVITSSAIVLPAGI